MILEICATFDIIGSTKCDGVLWLNPQRFSKATICIVLSQYPSLYTFVTPAYRTFNGV